MYGDQSVATGIFKTPVTGRIKVRFLGLEGDGQADLTAHGGPAKAVYAYPSEHYKYWEKELKLNLPYGMFGENLTTSGLLEDSLRIGDRFRAGSAELTVTKPRSPCFKLGIRFGAMDMVKRFQQSEKSGFYLAVSKEGEIEIGNSLHLISRNVDNPTIAEVFRSNVG
jgi:MOSC domain-containing protein YiiM